MQTRTSVVAVALLIFGIFMLVGFAPLGVALIIAAALTQSARSQMHDAATKGARAKLSERQRQQRDIAAKSLR